MGHTRSVRFSKRVLHASLAELALNPEGVRWLCYLLRHGERETNHQHIAFGILTPTYFKTAKKNVESNCVQYSAVAQDGILRHEKDEIQNHTLPDTLSAHPLFLRGLKYTKPNASSG